MRSNFPKPRRSFYGSLPLNRSRGRVRPTLKLRPGSGAANNNPTFFGREIPVITIGPNWATGCDVSDRYNTMVMEALDTSEDRERCTPRQQYDIEYQTLTLEAQETAYLRKVFELADDLPIFCPIWADQIRLTANAAKGSLTLQIDDLRDLRFTALPYVLIMDRFDNYEVVQIDFLADSGEEITLRSGTSKAWTSSLIDGQGAMLYPLCLGWAQRPEFSNMTDEFSVLPIQFSERFFDGIAEPPTAPELVLTQDACHSNITFTWGEVDAADGYILEYANDPDGPWTVFSDSIDAMTLSITVENAHATGLYWRMKTKVGTATSFPSNVAVSVVPDIALCVITVTNSTALPNAALPPVDTVYGGRRLNKSYVNKMDNPLIEPTLRYIKLTERRDYFYDPDSPTTSAITVTCSTPGVTIEWTTDGSDPILGGPNSQALPHQDGFSCMIKARAYKDDCASPLAAILVDKRVQALGFVSMNANVGTLASSCRDAFFQFAQVHNTEGACVSCTGGFTLTGDNCATIFNPPGIQYSSAVRAAFRAVHAAQACAAASPAINPNLYINRYNRNDALVGGNYPFVYTDSCPCSAIYGGGLYTINTQVTYATDLTFNRTTFWNGMPQVHANSIALNCDPFSPGDRYAGADDLPGATGVVSTIQAQASFSMLACRDVCTGYITTDDPPSNSIDQFRKFDRLQIILTREIDNAIFNPQ